MAITNHERVGKALALLSQGLAPFVDRECRAKYGVGDRTNPRHRPVERAPGMGSVAASTR